MACVKIYILSLLCALAGTVASVASSSVNEICKHSSFFFFVLDAVGLIMNISIGDLAHLATII